MAALLKNAACALQALEGVPPPAQASATREIEVEGVDRETLLVNWLNEILYLEQVDRLVCTDFQIYECKNHHGNDNGGGGDENGNGNGNDNGGGGGNGHHSHD